MNFIDQRVFDYIRDNPGVTSAQVANAIPVESRTYGRQQATSSAIARLRRAGKLKDVEQRCHACGCALTRGMRNQPLHVAEMAVAPAA